MCKEWKETEFPKVLYMNLETTRLRGRPRNGWQNEVKEDVTIVGGEEWQEKVYDTGMEEAATTVRNCLILHVPVFEGDFSEIFLKHTQARVYAPARSQGGKLPGAIKVWY
jgi:hypothetical protein